jgi:hypothetical protein
MAIQKKSLISTLKTTKKANVAKEEFSPATNEGTSTRKVARKTLKKFADLRMK